jgi:cytochrome c oxidase cbb3-type subunit 3
VSRMTLRCTVLLGLALARAAASAPEDALTESEIAEAQATYQQYCALCHGEDRSGYRADHAPSLRSASLLATGYPRFLYTAIGYGRANTAMEGYSTEMGGPLSRDQIRLLIRWLLQTEGVEPLDLDHDAVVTGDAAAGAKVYARQCAACHGEDGQGVSAPSLGDQALLANASDAFLKHAIMNGREGTPMVSFADKLDESQVNAVVAYLRSQASGWAPDPPALQAPPAPEEYVLNPDGPEPEFTLRDGRYVPAAQVVRALDEGWRFILLDTRPASAWQRSHIPGAVPMPYYRDKSRAGEGLPNDGTWIVAYCACPHAASDYVVNNLRDLGYERTAVIDEGILVWTATGLPVTAGRELDVE